MKVPTRFMRMSCERGLVRGAAFKGVG